MESEKLYLMIQQFAEDRAKVEMVKNILMSDVLDKYSKLDALFALFGIMKSEVPTDKN